MESQRHWSENRVGDWRTVGDHLAMAENWTDYSQGKYPQYPDECAKYGEN